MNSIRRGCMGQVCYKYIQFTDQTDTAQENKGQCALNDVI